MSWFSVREYTEKYNVSSSTVRRQIQKGRISARKFGRNWYIQYPDHTETESTFLQKPPMETTEPIPNFGTVTNNSLQSIIDFSSKTLHHYLLMHEQLVQEKEIRLREKETELQENRQSIAELEQYVKILESEIARLKEKPEGWR